MRSQFIVSILMFTSLALADATTTAPTAPTPAPVPAPTAPVDNCKVLRQAKVTAIVNKISWTQKDAIWVSSSELIAQSNGEIPVLQRYVGYSCNSSNNLLEVSDVVLNGVAQTGTIYASVDVYTLPNANTSSKTFFASYFIPGTNGTDNTASAGGVDPSLKQLTLGLGTVAATHEEYLQINVRFLDSDAQ